ncbi:MAG: hypothetical protein NZO16_02390 [Deltaproteobacteria bacterium]|nr:hypothetical protein [Deltaproteobacteria bacterium]
MNSLNTILGKMIRMPVFSMTLILGSSAVFLGCSVTPEKVSLRDKLEQLEKDFQEEYFSRVERHAQELLNATSKGSLQRKRVLELYALASEKNEKFDQAAKIFEQLGEEYPLSDGLRNWLFKSAENFLKSRTRKDGELKPLELAMSKLNQIVETYGNLSMEEENLNRQIKAEIEEHYERIARFYEKVGKKESAEVYRQKINKLKNL